MARCPSTGRRRGRRRSTAFVLCALLALPAAAQQRIAISDLGTGTYLGTFQGGLYENGLNTPPPDHFAAGLAAASRVRPLDRDGRPAPDGKVVLVSIGMSNTTQEFCAQGNPAPCTSWSFVGQALADPAVNKTTLLFVNGARGGQSAETWDSPNDPNYDSVRTNNLAPAGVTEAQVQVAWVKVANPGPRVSLPNANADAYLLVTQIGNIVRSLKTRYPNLRLVYLSSRIYAGYATTTLNPEPYAYESGFAVKSVIQAQIEQMRTGRIDARAGNLDSNAAAPWIGWGAYLWADGTNARADGLTWVRSDLEGDGTHPAQSGERKVGTLLLDFFRQEPTAKGWFLAATPRRRAAR